MDNYFIIGKITVSAGSEKSEFISAKAAYDFSDSIDRRANLAAFSSSDSLTATFIFGPEKDPGLPSSPNTATPLLNECEGSKDITLSDEIVLTTDSIISSPQDKVHLLLLSLSLWLLDKHFKLIINRIQNLKQHLQMNQVALLPLLQQALSRHFKIGCGEMYPLLKRLKIFLVPQQLLDGSIIMFTCFHFH